MIHVFPVGKTATGIPTDLTGCPTDSPTAAVHKMILLPGPTYLLSLQVVQHTFLVQLV